MIPFLIAVGVILACLAASKSSKKETGYTNDNFEEVYQESIWQTPKNLN